MMASREVRFHERKAAGEEAARWLQPVASRAEGEGQKDVMVSLKDLKDLLRYVVSQQCRDAIEFQGKRLGYARHEDMRAILAGDVKGVCIKRVRGPKFNIEVYFREMPEYVPEVKEGLQSA